MCKIRFGTDGWRACIGDEFTFSNVQRIAQAVADYLTAQKSNPCVVVGYDTRFMSKDFAQCVCEVLAANNVKTVISKEFCSTPCISFITAKKEFDLGIVITASHNPYYFNGFKIKTSWGGAASKDLTNNIELLVDKHEILTMEYQQGLNEGRIKEKDLKKDYINFIKNFINIRDIKRRFKGKIIVDYMYGSAQGVMEEVFPFLKMVFLRKSINPYFEYSRPEPVEQNLQTLISFVKRKGFSMGIAFDGDGDRLSSVMENGKFLHPQKILPLLALYLNESRGWKGAIIKTVVGSLLIDKVAQYLNSEVIETPIGFKYISEEFQNREVLIGGEEAGGIGVKNYIPERDGVMCASLLIEMLSTKRKPLSVLVEEMERKFGKYYYLRKDIHLSDKRDVDLEKITAPEDLLSRKVVGINKKDGLKFITPCSWLMLRKSGTEPLIRIYAEAPSLKEARQLISLGEEILTNNDLLAS